MVITKIKVLKGPTHSKNENLYFLTNTPATPAKSATIAITSPLSTADGRKEGCKC